MTGNESEKIEKDLKKETPINFENINSAQDCLNNNFGGNCLANSFFSSPNNYAPLYLNSMLKQYAYSNMVYSNLMRSSFPSFGPLIRFNQQQ